MAVLNKPLRKEVLRKQKIMYEIHCKSCVNKKEKSNTWCEGCNIYEKFLEIGKVLDSTLAPRKSEAG